MNKECSQIFQVFVKTNTERYFSLDAQPFDTIKTLKTKIQEKLNTPMENQVLSFAGRSLKNEDTLECYNIRNECYLTLQSQQQ